MAFNGLGQYGLTAPQGAMQPAALPVNPMQQALMMRGLTFPQQGLFAQDAAPPNTRLPRIKEGLLGDEATAPEASWTSGYDTPSQDVAPSHLQGAGGPPPAAAGGSTDDKFMQLLNNPMFQFGINLLGNSTNPNPWGGALNNTLSAQLQSAQAKRQQTQASVEQQRANQEYELGKGRLDVSQQELAQKAPLVGAQTSNLNAETMLHGAQAQQATRQQALIEQYMQGLGGGAPPQQGDPQASQGGMLPTSTGQAPQGGPPGQAAQQGLFNLPPGVDPRAIGAELAFNGGKGIGAVIQKQTEPIVAQNGMVYQRTPGGGVQIAPGSLDAMRQVSDIQEGVKGQYGTTSIPLSNGQALTVSPTEFRAFQATGQLPGRYANFQQGVATPQGANPTNNAIGGGQGKVAATPAEWQNRNAESIAAQPGRNKESISILQDELASETDPANRAALTREIARMQGLPVGGGQVGVTQAESDKPSFKLQEQQAAVTMAGQKQQTAHVAQEVNDAQAKQAEAQANAKMEVSSITSGLDRLHSKAAEVLAMPGLESNTGLRGWLGEGKIPNTAGHDTQLQLDTLRSKLMVGVLSDLKTASKNGSSGFGQLSEQEGKTLSTFQDNLEQAQTLPQMKKALADIQLFAESSRGRYADRFNSLYGSSDKPSVAPSIGAQKAQDAQGSGGNTQSAAPAPMSYEDYIKSKRTPNKNGVAISPRERMGNIGYGGQ